MCEFYECHGHIMMDGADFRTAYGLHRDGVNKDAVRGTLSALRSAGVTHFRDGGDALGVSEYARDLAPGYGIHYLTPIFAIHKKGFYGGIVGRAYETESDFRALIAEMRDRGGDFVKLMVSGIVTFQRNGELSCPSLPEEEIISLVRIAHEEGYAVMIHGNGPTAVRASIRAGADSIEHGVFADDETLRMLADSEIIWVPTIAAIAAFAGRDGFPYAEEITKRHLDSVAKAFSLGANIACGSDSGAVGVPHGAGTLRERELLLEAGVTDEAMKATGREIFRRFGNRNRKY